jgi:hypothetical protein
MRALVMLVALALFALSTAQAQVSSGTGKSKLQNDGPMKEDKGPKADDKAYGNALGNLPNKKYDPWKNMR